MAGKFGLNTAAKKKIRVGSIVFYILFFLFIAAFAVGVSMALNWLDDWLIRYEASQPTVKNEEVFSQLFGDPNWEKLYEMAKEEDTIYENSQTYAAYMEEKVGNESLTWLETSAGLSGDKKYIVRLGNEKVATYTLTNTAAEDDPMAQWELGEVEIFYTRTQDVTVQLLPGYTVHINGVALDDSFTIRTTSTVVEEYLPEGIHGYRTMVQYIDGLLMHPEVSVRDSQGNEAELVYDSETNTYTQTAVYEELIAPVKNTIVGAAQVYGKYMIEAVGSRSLREYFDSQSEIYKKITSVERWAQRHTGYDFTEPEITGYFRYSDTLCSAQIKMTMLVTRPNGTVKEYPLDTTYFMERKDDGKWYVVDLTYVDVQEQITQVKLRYVVDGREVHSEMVDTHATSVTLPEVTAPEGKEFLGWFMKTVDEKGKTTMTLVFAPAEGNVLYLPEGSELSHMTLHAQFQ